jgi:hypothetical protein
LRRTVFDTNDVMASYRHLDGMRLRDLRPDLRI